MNNNKLFIDIVIPTYFENKSRRYFHTEKIFKYMDKLAKSLIRDKIILSFTVVGCNTELSINLFKDIFGHNSNNSYVIFTQFGSAENGVYWLNPKIKEMLNNKFKIGLTHSIKKNKDITMVMGSNDLICKEFYKQIYEKYNKNEKQFYGINNRHNNAVIFFEMDNQLKLNDKSLLGIWDGKYPNVSGHSDNKYAGGTFGFNKCIYEKIHIFNEWSNECLSEMWCEQILNCNLILFESIYYFNIKTGYDITKPESFLDKLESINTIKIKNETIYNSIIDTINTYNSM